MRTAVDVVLYVLVNVFGVVVGAWLFLELLLIALKIEKTLVFGRFWSLISG